MQQVRRPVRAIEPLYWNFRSFHAWGGDIMKMCWLIRRGLVTHQDGTLGRRKAQWVARHLPTCHTCQRELQDLQRVTHLLHALPGPSRPSAYWPAALRQLQRKIQQRPPEPVRSGWFNYLTGLSENPAPALVSVALVGMALFGTVTFLGLEDAAFILVTSYLLPMVLQ
jgi:anti-sigma factor RsiW